MHFNNCCRCEVFPVYTDRKPDVCQWVGSGILYKGRIHNRKTAANQSQDCVLLFHAQRNNLHILMHFQC